METPKPLVEGGNDGRLEVVAPVPHVSRQRTGFVQTLTSITPFLSSVLVAGVALVVNATYDERQSLRAAESQAAAHRLSSVEALGTFMPYLSGTPESKEAALYAISALGYPDLVIRLTQLQRTADPTVSEEVGDAVMRVAFSPSETAPPDSKAEPIGWLYLGRYSGDGTWTTRYLDFRDTTLPDSLVGTRLTVREQTGALNLRDRMPNENAQFGRVVRALQPGESVRLLEVLPWATTGFMWARVTGS